MSEPEAFYRQAIDLNRYSNHVAINVMRSYNNIVVDAASKLNDIGSLNPREAARLNTLLLQTKESLATWAGDSSVYLMQELQGLALLEDEFIVQQIKNVVKPELVPGVRSVEITPDFAKAIVMDDPTDLNAAVFQRDLQGQIEGVAPGKVRLDAAKGSALVLPNGKTLDTSFRQLAEASAAKFRVTVQDGMLTGENMRDMVKRLRGDLRFNDAADIARTAAKGGTLTTLSDAQIRALIRTSVTQVSNTVNNQVYAANQDVIAAYRYRAVLDFKTTAICQSLDGRVFKFGKGPEPPQHFGCRSTIVMVTRSEAEGDVQQRGKRAALGGLVPVDQQYGTWLANRTVQQQNEALGGKGKGDVFRSLLKKGESGDIAIRKFVSNDGSELTLKNLQAKYGAS
jgi:SPP1 gp7 family putative phage head morphogenesis protein